MELLCGRVIDVRDDRLELADRLAPSAVLAPHLDELLGQRAAEQRGDVVPGRGAPLRPHREAVLAGALQREGDSGVVDGVLRHDVGHAGKLVRPGLEDLATGCHVVEEVLDRYLRALGTDSTEKISLKNALIFFCHLSFSSISSEQHSILFLS